MGFGWNEPPIARRHKNKDPAERSVNRNAGASPRIRPHRHGCGRPRRKETAMTDITAIYENEESAEMFLLQHERYINCAIKLCGSLVETAKLETEDLKQELRLTMWQAAGKFVDDSRAKLSTYLVGCMRHRIFKLCRAAFAQKRRANLHTSPFVYQNEDGEWVERELPETVCYDDILVAREFADALTAAEKGALYRKLANGGPRTKRDVSLLAEVRRKMKLHEIGRDM